MKLWKFKATKIVAVGCSFAMFLNVAAADSGLQKQATWSWPTKSDLDQQLSKFVHGEQIDAALKQSAEQLLRQWSDVSASVRGPELLDQWLRLAAGLDPELQTLQQSLQSTNSQADPQAAAMQLAKQFESLATSLPTYLSQNFRLAIGRQLAQNQLYDEAIEMLEPLDVDQIVDPSTLLFYRAVALHHVLRRDECVAAADQLLQREDELVSRYAVLSRLMRADIKPLEEDSLDEIARLMNDVKRRLDLERAGKIVQTKEDTIIEKLDKKIDQIEQQLQQQQQQQQQAQSQQQPTDGKSKPMEQSQVAGGSGPGDVDKKPKDNESGWGDLPPAQRQEALQNLTQEMPSHYIDIIEAYFKRLASSEGR